MLGRAQSVPRAQGCGQLAVAGVWASPSAGTGVMALLPALSVSQPLGCIVPALGFLYSLQCLYSVHAETISWQRPAAQNEALPQAANGNPALVFFLLIVDFFKASLCQSTTGIDQSRQLM